MNKPQQPTVVYTEEIREEDVKWTQDLYEYYKAVNPKIDPLEAVGPGTIHPAIREYIGERKLGWLKTFALVQELKTLIVKK